VKLLSFAASAWCVRLGALLIASFAMAGCAHQWESVLDGRPYTRTNPKLYPISITAVDGEYGSGNPRYVDAGTRRLTIDAPPVAGFSQPVRKEFTFKIERCIRYWLAAQRVNALTQDFDLIIDHAEAVPGCTPYGVPEKGIVVPANTPGSEPVPIPKRTPIRE
jgi:hypothetical protein